MRSIGLGMAGIYGFNALYRGWNVPGEPSWLDDSVSWASVALLLLLYCRGYRIILHDRMPVRPKTIVLPAILLVSLGASIMPYRSTDAFLYVAMARAEAYYGVNPYADLMSSVPDIVLDPAVGAQWMRFNLNAWPDLPLVYGFLFADLLHVIGWAAQGSWWAALLLIKLINVGAYFLTAWMIWLAARDLGHRPEYALYLFLFSPLILIQQVGEGHNDILMGCLIVAGFYAVLRQREFWAAPLLVVAALVKYVAVVLVPFALFVVVKKRGWMQAAGSALVATGIMVAAGLPYWGESSRFIYPLILAQMSKFTAGPLTGVLYYSYSKLSLVTAPFGPLEEFGFMLQVAFGGVATVLLAWTAWYFVRSEASAERTAYTWTLVLSIIVFVASPQFYAWYIGMLFPLALLLKPGRWLRELVTILSVTHLASVLSIGNKAIHYFIVGNGGALIWLSKSRALVRTCSSRMSATWDSEID